MMSRRMVLGKVVCTVQFAGGPVQIELLLQDTVFQPVVAHVERLGFFHANGGMEYAVGSGVVGFKGDTGGGLGMTHFFKGCDHWDCFLGIEEETGSFGFGSG